MSHTPGPWRVEPSYENIPGGGELRAIGTSYQWPEGEAAFCALAFTPRLGIGPYAANREDDAQLMAAAPDLIDAMKVILEGFEKGIFVRSIDHDHEPMWLLGIAVQIAALAKGQRAIDQAESR